MSKIECNLNINGTSKNVVINEDKPLIFVIRDEFGLTGTKLGCGLGQCGSCAVLVDGKKKNSCNILAKDYQRSEITTIEGLKTKKGLNIVQKAFKEFMLHNVVIALAASLFLYQKFSTKTQFPQILKFLRL